jgi:hypothetical protein
VTVQMQSSTPLPLGPPHGRLDAGSFRGIPWAHVARPPDSCVAGAAQEFATSQLKWLKSDWLNSEQQLFPEGRSRAGSHLNC